MSVRYRVLLVEDSVQDASINIRALERAGLDLESERVETASQMEAALEAKPWDFILCDFHLPEFDGLAALDLYHARVERAGKEESKAAGLASKPHREQKKRRRPGARAPSELAVTCEDT